MSKELYIDNFRLTAYRAAAEKVMQIADDRERMQQIGRLISKILTERPLMKHCIGRTHYRFFPNTTDENNIPRNPQDRSLKLRWADYKAYYNNPDNSILVGYEGDYIDFDDLDALNEWANEPLPDPPDWVNDDSNNPFLDEDWEHKDHDHITELTELLDALQTEYDLLAAVNSLTQDIPDTAAGKTYKSSRDEAELTAIFNALTGKTNPKDRKAVFLPADSDLQGWLWICTGRLGKQPKEPLEWLGTPTELALMVDKLFGHKWAVTLTWFRYKSDVDGQWKRPTNTFLSKQCKNSTIDFTELGKVLKPFCPDIRV